MKYTLSTHEAAQMLFDDEFANWSWEGALALVEHLEEIESWNLFDTGIETEFDRVAIRCDFGEYKSLSDFASEYNYTGSDDDDEIRDFISENGTLIEFDGGVIVSQF